MIKEFHNEDCLPAMRKFPDNYFHLSICDPPYGIGEDGRKNHTRGNLAKASDYRNFSRYDKYKPDQEYFSELIRVSKNQIIWGANHFGNMPASSCWIIWDKDNGKNDFADCELAYTSFNSAARKFNYRWNGMLQKDMKNKEIRLHPNQKPVQLYKWLLRNYANCKRCEGYGRIRIGNSTERTRTCPQCKNKKPIILSTHVGSASDLIAFEDFGCQYVGYELDKSYFKSALKRLNQHKAQLKLEL